MQELSKKNVKGEVMIEFSEKSQTVKTSMIYTTVLILHLYTFYSYNLRDEDIIM